MSDNDRVPSASCATCGRGDEHETRPILAHCPVHRGEPCSDHIPKLSRSLTRVQNVMVGKPVNDNLPPLPSEPVMVDALIQKWAGYIKHDTDYEQYPEMCQVIDEFKADLHALKLAHDAEIATLTAEMDGLREVEKAVREARDNAGNASGIGESYYEFGGGDVENIDVKLHALDAARKVKP